MKSISETVGKKPWLGWVLFLLTMVIVFFLGLLASSIMERRAEAQFVYTPQVEYADWEPRSDVWGGNLPREYNTWKMTSDTTFRSQYNGSVFRDALEESPELVVMWAGYAFAKDYNQPRGHYYALTDIQNTLRVGAPMDGKESPQPNTCWTCKSPDVPRLMSEMGISNFYKGTWEKLGHEVVNPIGCADCHDAKTMNLRISRPALVEAFQNMGKDVTKATHQEMRSLVCAQCHVEYYFNKKNEEKVPYLTFPWHNGFSAEEMEAYYDKVEHVDWVHSISKAPMLKAQHPDYELFLSGIHAERGLSCADCHMPYVSEGGQKYTSHHISSPLRYVHLTCQVCHREETEQLVENVTERQEKIMESRKTLEHLLTKAHVEAGFAWEKGATEAEMKPILNLIRKSQWRWDYVAASHGGSFHSPVESGRLLADGINLAQEARLELARLLAKKGITDPVPMPDISTKALAQKYIGFDAATAKAEKKVFLEKVVPEWLAKAKERESKYPVKSL